MRSAEILERINALPKMRVRLMEVCGTHTMAIAKAGIKRLLPDGVELVSGPGCPVCVTPPELMDAALELASRPGVTVASYGDMIRVPGSRRGDDLAHRRARGGSVELVYSPMDAVELAKRQPEREVVFLGVGFETTAPGTAASVMAAREQGVRNFSVFPMFRLVEPALRALIGSEGFDVQGFLCPGHVAVVTGAEHFRFLPEEYGLPAVVAGFEAKDILLSVYELLRMLSEGRPGLVNEYKRAVSAEGNALAQEMLRRAFRPARASWRGLGEIDGSGLEFAEELAEFDAVRKFGISLNRAETPTACRCGEVITGRMPPECCPLFGKICTPEDPVGPCMVSSEGACAAAYKYREC